LAEGVDAQALWDLSASSEAGNLHSSREASLKPLINHKAFS
jgi:hypothetical protein